MSSKTAWLYLGPTFSYFRIRAAGELQFAAKEPLYLGWQGIASLEESQLEDLIYQQLKTWRQTLDQHTVDSIQITLSPALGNAPLLVILRQQFKDLDLPMPTVWNEIEEVQHLTQAIPESKSDILLFGVGEHRLYLIDRRAAQIEWHAALPLGLIDLQREYCQVEPAEQPKLVEMRRRIVTYLELIQWHVPPPKVAIVSDAALLLATGQNGQFVLARAALEKLLPIITKNPPRQVCRQFGINSPLGLLLLPTALICQHILDYLQLPEIEIYPFELQV